MDSIEKLVDMDKIKKVNSEDDVISLLTPILAKLQEQNINLQKLLAEAKEEENEGSKE